MEKNFLKAERSLSVVRQNDIVQKARYKLDLVQQKTLMYLISKINSLKDVEFQEIDVDIKDLCEIMGIKYNGRSLKDFQDAIQKMADKSLWVDTGTQLILMRWLQRVIIDKGSTTVTVKFDELMAPYLLQIQNRFVQYKLVNVLPMKSQYSLRLYELIKSREAMGKWTVILDDLRKDLFVENIPTYADYRDFKKRILDPAIIEICNFTDLMVSFEPKRKDRKIYSLTFEMCNIDEANCAEGARREINQKTVLDNMPAEVVPPRKMPTAKDIRALREKQRKATELDKMIKKQKRAKSAGGASMQDDYMPGQTAIEELMN